MVVPAPDRNRLIRLLLGYMIAIAAIWGAAHFAKINVEAFTEALVGVSPRDCIAALIAFTACSSLNAVGFSFLMGPATCRRIAAIAWLAALPAKYAPVGIGHVIGRGVFLARHGVSLTESIRSSIQEQLASLALCAGAAAGAWWLTSTTRSSWVAASILFATTVIACVVGIGATLPHSAARWRRAIAAVAFYSLALVAFGIGYWWLLEPHAGPRFLFGLFAGTVAGILAVLAPGGLGVREATTSALLDDPSRALAALMAARALLLISELMLAAAAYAFMLRQRA